MEKASFLGAYNFFMVWVLISVFLFFSQLIGLMRIPGTPEILVSIEHLLALLGFGALLELIRPADEQSSKTKPQVVSAILWFFLAAMLVLASFVSLSRGRIPHFLLLSIVSIPLIVLNVRKLMQCSYSFREISKVSS